MVPDDARPKHTDFHRPGPMRRSGLERFLGLTGPLHQDGGGVVLQVAGLVVEDICSRSWASVVNGI